MTAPPKEPRCISVLIPVPTDADQLVAAHAEALSQLEKLGPELEFLYLVSADSSDLLSVLRTLQEADPKRIRVIHFGHSVGGAALLSAGVGEARGEVLFTLPPCHEVESEALTELYAVLESGADLAFARRGSGSEQAPARVQTRIFNKLLAWAAGTSFSDVTADTRAIRREVLQEVPLYGEFHRYLPLLAERVGFSVREVAAREHPACSPYRYSPVDYLWRGLDVLSIFFLSRFTRRPLRLFGGLGSLFAAVGGLILGIVTFQRLFLGQGLADRPILVLSALLFGLGVQIFTIGLLGELILFFHARSIRDYRIAAIYEADGHTPPEASSSREAE